MIELVEYLVSTLVPEGDHPVAQTHGDGATEIVNIITKNDIPKIIGRHGKIARAIRTLVKSANAGGSVRYNVVIEEKNEL